ncbi:hypothetical protein AO889_03300 [Pseudomonas aeruginosa]|nr:hypothetical protein AO889_03300 [Pseudomonas aeruginosa]KSD07917.1 hypothetical protein AO890_03300 [Pseudomonas aeruginosa]KSH27386.1 hypothetical protein AO962_00725 [Pseudomonas aeruginosa]
MRKVGVAIHLDSVRVEIDERFQTTLGDDFAEMWQATALHISCGGGIGTENASEAQHFITSAWPSWIGFGRCLI